MSKESWKNAMVRTWDKYGPGVMVSAGIAAAVGLWLYDRQVLTHTWMLIACVATLHAARSRYMERASREKALQENLRRADAEANVRRLNEHTARLGEENTKLRAEQAAFDRACEVKLQPEGVNEGSCVIAGKLVVRELGRVKEERIAVPAAGLYHLEVLIPQIRERDRGLRIEVEVSNLMQVSAERGHSVLCTSTRFALGKLSAGQLIRIRYGMSDYFPSPDAFDIRLVRTEAS